MTDINYNEDWSDIYASIGFVLSGDIDELKRVKVAIGEVLKDFEVNVVYQKTSINKLYLSEER